MPVGCMWKTHWKGRLARFQGSGPFIGRVRIPSKGFLRMQTGRHQPIVVLTVGHSTRAQEDFIGLLHAHAVKRLVDVKETARQAVNQWTRNSGAFDGAIDSDRVLRNPDHPSRLLPRMASGDHLRPNDDGYQAMADAAIDLALFR